MFLCNEKDKSVIIFPHIYFCGDTAADSIFSLGWCSSYNYPHCYTSQKSDFCWYVISSENNSTAFLVSADVWGSHTTASLMTPYFHFFL